MKERLAEGQEYGTDFWRPSKSDLYDARKKHSSRYKEGK